MLHVTGRLENGYHALQTLIGFASLGDQLELMPQKTPGFSLEIEGAYGDGLETSETNLVIKAALWLQKRLGYSTGAHFRLLKNLPIGGGVGGGSSDAAAAIAALLSLWGHDLTDGLVQASGVLGADVPVCLAYQLSCQKAQKEGRGGLFWLEGSGTEEKPEPLLKLDPQLEFPLLLVNPGVPLSTPQVFRHFKEQTKLFSPPVPSPMDLACREDLVKFWQSTGNDLTEAAMACEPSIGDILSSLAEQEGCLLSRLSGSGGTCYGLFDSLDNCQEAATKLQTTAFLKWVAKMEL